MIARLLLRLVLAFVISILGSFSAMAQYGGGSGGSTGTGGTSTGGGYGSGAAVGIGVAAAAGIGVAILALHKPSVIGCLEPSSDGVRLMNERDKKTYMVLAQGEDLKAGNRVELRGKKNKDRSGRLDFQVQKLVKDYGPCTPADEHAKADLKHE